MFALPTEALGALGAIVAALIAATFSLLGLVISKEHKVSEFRQAWSDALREDVALLITHLECLRGAAHAATPERASWADRKEHFIAVNRAITSIQLRVGTETAESTAFRKALDELTAAAEGGDIGTSALIGPAVERLIEAARRVIDLEWALIRRGEGVYLWSRRTALGVMLTAVAGLCFLAPLWLRGPRSAGGSGAASAAKDQQHNEVDVFVCPAPVAGHTPCVPAPRQSRHP